MQHRESQKEAEVVEIYYRLGQVRNKLGERKKALNMFEKALEIDPASRLTLEAVIELQMQELSELMKGTDGYAIEQQTKRLSQVTDAFAARRLDSTVKAALAGRNLNEIEE